MKKQDTAAFSLIRCDTEKKMPALAVRAIRAALFFAGLLAVAQGAAGIWTNYGWLWAAAGAAALNFVCLQLALFVINKIKTNRSRARAFAHGAAEKGE